MWHFMDTKAPWDGVLAPGESNTLLENYFSYDGQASDVLLKLDYSRFVSPGLALVVAKLSFASKAEYFMYLEAARNRHEASKFQRVAVY